MRPIDGQYNNRISVPPTRHIPPTTHTAPPAAAPSPSAHSVVQYAFGSPITVAKQAQIGPGHTFDSGKPAYNPNIGGNFTSNNGQEAANDILRLENQSLVGFSQPDEAQLINQSLATHQNDPQYLGQFFNTLGTDRAAQYLRYQTSLGHVNIPGGFSPTSANAADLTKQNRNLATALSTMAASHVLTQPDMDKLVTSVANEKPEGNFSFTNDVLSRTSPEVRQMFYLSARDYALSHLDTSAGQAMAANAAQALSFAPPATQTAELEALRHVGYGSVGSVDRLPDFLKAAMQGEARYGNPPSLAEFAETGTYRPQHGLGQPLTGVSTLISNAALGLTSKDAALQQELFATKADVLRSDPSLQKHYDAIDGLQQADSVDKQISSREAALRGANDPSLQPNDTGIYDAFDAVPTVNANSQMIKDIAAKYGVDPALLAGTVASEMDFDHSLKDYFQDGFGRLGIHGGNGPGIASVHRETLDWARDYLKTNRPAIAAQYPKDAGNPNEFPNSVRDAAVVLSALVAYREDQSKASGIPATSSSPVDMAVIWGAYRTGIQGVTPGGRGYTPEGFLQNQAQGSAGQFEVGKNAYISQPYFELFQKTLG